MAVSTAIGNKRCIDPFGCFPNRPAWFRFPPKRFRKILSLLKVCIPTPHNLEPWDMRTVQPAGICHVGKIVMAHRIVADENRRVTLCQKWPVPLTMGIATQQRESYVSIANALERHRPNLLKILL